MIKLTDLLEEIQGSLKQQALDFLNSRKNAFTWGSSDHKIVLKIIKDITNMQDDTGMVPYLKQYTAVSTPKLIRDPATGMLTADPSAPKTKKYSYGIKYMISDLVKKLSPQQPLAEGKKEEPKIEAFENFAEVRGKGADKIATNAEEKGGLALLTWHHFKVKAPYYKKAAEGKFNTEQAEKEYKELLEKLYKATSKQMDITQTRFQELVGKIEVLGELLIKHK